MGDLQTEEPAVVLPAGFSWSCDGLQGECTTCPALHGSFVAAFRPKRQEVSISIGLVHFRFRILGTVVEYGDQSTSVCLLGRQIGPRQDRYFGIILRSSVLSNTTIGWIGFALLDGWTAAPAWRSLGSALLFSSERGRLVSCLRRGPSFLVHRC